MLSTFDKIIHCDTSITRSLRTHNLFSKLPRVRSTGDWRPTGETSFHFLCVLVWFSLFHSLLRPLRHQTLLKPYARRNDKLVADFFLNNFVFLYLPSIRFGFAHEPIRNQGTLHPLD